MFSLISLYFAARQQLRTDAPVIAADRHVVVANDSVAAPTANAA